MARRFIVNENNIENIDDKEIKINGTEVKHIQVLRFNINDRIAINDGIYEILEMKRDFIRLKFISKNSDFGVPNINLRLYIAVLKGEKMDLVIKKAVEIGVSEIIPFFSKNTVVKIDKKEYEKKKQKYEKIVIEAEKQCGRTDSVKINDFMTFEEVLEDVKNNDLTFFAYEKSKSKLRDVILNINKNNVKNIAVIIGPEGGFTDYENSILSNKENVKNISISNRILMSETAALSLCSIIMYEFD